MVISILGTTTQHAAIEGKTQTNDVDFYNLDAIIAVGYRIHVHKTGLSCTRHMERVHKTAISCTYQYQNIRAY